MIKNKVWASPQSQDSGASGERVEWELGGLGMHNFLKQPLEANMEKYHHLS